MQDVYQILLLAVAFAEAYELFLQVQAVAVSSVADLIAAVRSVIAVKLLDLTGC